LEQIADLCSSGVDIRKAKEVLAFEVTKLAHGAEQAIKAGELSKSLFGDSSGSLDSMPTTEIKESVLRSGITVVDLFCLSGLTPTKSAAIRLINQGGAYINDVKISSTKDVVNENSLMADGRIILRKGKKTFHLVTIEKGK
ncbi:MAG: tyrosine--tRNA ligase, partial [bacterium]|nr:tyrosine--tRNA ligase [bacterium]